MNWFSGIVVFVIVWWIVLFAVLPWGLRHETPPPETGFSPGAPLNPGLARKFLVTTGIAAIIWLAVYALVQSDLISFNKMSIEMARDDVQ